MSERERGRGHDCGYTDVGGGGAARNTRGTGEIDQECVRV